MQNARLPVWILLQRFASSDRQLFYKVTEPTRTLRLTYISYLDFKQQCLAQWPKLEREMGFEPTTTCLGSRHSTAELLSQSKNNVHFSSTFTFYEQLQKMNKPNQPNKKPRLPPGFPFRSADSIVQQTTK